MAGSAVRGRFVPATFNRLALDIKATTQDIAHAQTALYYSELATIGGVAGGGELLVEATLLCLDWSPYRVAPTKVKVDSNYVVRKQESFLPGGLPTSRNAR